MTAFAFLALALTAEIWLAVPLSFGWWSPCLALALLGPNWPGVGPQATVAGLTLALALRELLRSQLKPAERLRSALLDAIPAILIGFLSFKLGIVLALPLALLIGLALPQILAYRWSGQDRAWGTLLPERAALLLLATLAGILQLHHPLAWLWVLPLAWLLRRQTLLLLQLDHFRTHRLETRQERRSLNHLEQRLEGVASQQRQLESLLQARSRAFEMLEKLPLDGLSPQQLLQQMMAIIELQFPRTFHGLFQLEPDGLKATTVRYPPAQAPDPRRLNQILSGQSPQWFDQELYWPFSRTQMGWIRFQDTHFSDSAVTMNLFLRYGTILVERAEFHQKLLTHFDYEVALRQKLTSNLEQLTRLAESAATLAGLERPGDIETQCLPMASRLLGERPCQLVQSEEVGNWPLGSGRWLKIHGLALSPDEEHIARLWSHLVSASLSRSQALLELSQSSRLAAIGQLAAGLAHELNTPLGSITLALQVAQDSLESRPERAATRLRQAQAAADHMQGIIHRLLYYSREAGQGRRKVVLEGLLQDSLAMLKHREDFGSPEVTIEGNWQVEVECNPGEIQQILLNLLSNAAESLRDLCAGQIRLKCQAIPGVLEILVKDNGPGVPEEIRDRIFEPFFSTREVGRGSGLGLPISRQIAEKHGGGLEYLPGHPGAIFRLRIPRT